MLNLLHGVICPLLICYTCASLSPEDVAKLKADIAESHRCRGQPGLAVTVVKDGQVVLAEGFGLADLERNIPVTNRTVFGIASLSKAFASTLLLKLISRRDDVTLDTKVKDLIPEFGFPEDDLRTEHTTLEDILSHRTGLSSNNRIRFDTNLTRANLAGRINKLSASGEWRGSYMYSNLLYGVVTRIAEVLGGASWEELVKEEIYDPLNMDSSTFATLADFSSDSIAKPYWRNGNISSPVHSELSRRWALLCGSGCVMTSALDAANWIKFHLSKGLGPSGERVMDEADLGEEYKARIPIPSPLRYFNQPDVPVSTILDKYAFGWRIGSYRGNKLIAHTGSTFGYYAFLSLMPSENIGIFMAGTGYDPSYMYRVILQNYILDSLLGVTPWLNVSTLCSFPEPWFPAPRWSSNSLSKSLSGNKTDYIGTYHNTPYGYLDIYYNETQGQLMLKYGFGTFLLFEQDVGNFFGQGFGIVDFVQLRSVIFKKKDNYGKYLEVSVPGFDSRLPPLFSRQEYGTNSETSDSGSDLSRPLSWLVLIYFVSHNLI